MTCNAYLGATVKIDEVFDKMEISPTGFVWAECPCYNRRPRGVYPKKPKARMLDGSARAFDNQMTIVYLIPGADGATRYYANIKIFNTGRMTITGVRSEEEGLAVLETVRQEIRRIWPDLELGAPSFNICMINSDFKVNYEIKRRDLHKLLISDEYNNRSFFEPGLYQGVKVQYFYNKNNARADGICCCKTQCEGRAAGEGRCKKVTICVFESGAVLITGANAFNQIDEAYAYITKIFAEREDDLRKPVIERTKPSE